MFAEVSDAELIKYMNESNKGLQAEISRLQNYQWQIESAVNCTDVCFVRMDNISMGYVMRITNETFNYTDIIASNISYNWIISDLFDGTFYN